MATEAGVCRFCRIADILYRLYVLYVGLPFLHACVTAIHPIPHPITKKRGAGCLLLRFLHPVDGLGIVAVGKAERFGKTGACGIDALVGIKAGICSFGNDFGSSIS